MTVVYILMCIIQSWEKERKRKESFGKKVPSCHKYMNLLCPCNPIGKGVHIRIELKDVDQAIAQPLEENSC